MTTYAEYVEHIPKLQSLAEAARKDETNEVVQKIKALTESHCATNYHTLPKPAMYRLDASMTTMTFMSSSPA